MRPGRALCRGTVTCGAGEQCCETLDVDGNPVDTCVAIGRDEAHCGGCGQACGTAEACRSGTCRCQPGSADCDGDASNGCEARLAVEPEHCGTCGNACASGEVCDGRGQCATTCQSGRTDCDGKCIDLSAETQHCGACGASCGAGAVCNGLGQCTVTCVVGYSLCRDGCFDLVRDRDHCGACYRACPSGTVCNGAAQCTPQCQPGLSLCGGLCVDTDRYRKHCGACGNTCPDGEVCNGAGQCALECLPSLTDCGGSCVDTATDFAHCGACGEACQAGERCQAGRCVSLDCPSGLARCGEACVDTSSDGQHCGACGNTCSMGQVCDGGQCVCAGGLTACGGSCVDTLADVGNCGACGNACATDEICDEGTCVLRGACSPGRTLCTDVCADLMNDRRHCGQCDTACPAGKACVAGTCACPDGFGDCDGDGSGYCEANLDNNRMHCGGCGSACLDGQICTDGTCVCPDYLIDCDGDGTCETNIQSDAAACGACGMACGSGEVCRSGVCTMGGRQRVATTWSSEGNYPSGFSCVIDAAGGVQCTGDNAAGRLGRDTSPALFADGFAPVAGLTGATAIMVTTGANHVCALLDDGAVACWGSNQFGQLGDPNAGSSETTPVTPVGLDGTTPVAQIDAGENHTCAVLQSGEVRCWGDDASGQIGDGTAGDTATSPTQVSGLDGTTSIVEVRAGTMTSCARTESGAVSCWGEGSRGGLGDGLETDSATPVQVSGLDGSGPDATAISLAVLNRVGCVGLASEGVLCWGFTNQSVEGVGALDPFSISRFDNAPTPIPVVGLPPRRRALELSAGNQQTLCALLDDGTTWCWGHLVVCHPGGTTSPVAAPHPIADTLLETAISAGTALFVEETGDIVVRGTNASGALGAPTFAQRAEANAAVVAPTCDPFDTASCTALSASDISVGPVGCAVTTGGDLACWGANCGREEQFCTFPPCSRDRFECDLLGQGRDRELIGSGVPQIVGGVTDAVQVAVGTSGACARTSTGEVWCWGGIRGVGMPTAFTPTTPALTLDATTPDTTATDIAVGGTKFGSTACAVLETGALTCWGANRWGQVGNGTTDDAWFPEPVTGLDGSTMATMVTDVAVGEEWTCAILATGGVKCWGRGNVHQLGTGTASTTPQSTPVDVAGLDGTSRKAVDLTLGFDGSCAVFDDGSLDCWGSPCSICTPIATPQTLTDIDGTTRSATEVVVGDSTTCALFDDGSVECFPQFRAELGSVVPGLDGSARTAVSISGAAGWAVCARLDDDNVVCWGDGRMPFPGAPGILGDGRIGTVCELSTPMLQ